MKRQPPRTEVQEEGAACPTSPDTSPSVIATLKANLTAARNACLSEGLEVERLKMLLLNEREVCCRAMCTLCRVGYELVTEDPPHVSLEGKAHHRIRGTLYVCRAAAIRQLPTVLT